MYGAAAGLPPTLAQFEGSTPIAMNVIPICKLQKKVNERKEV
jgi:hypothetical protein